jgi:hypothetical protein
MLAAIASPIQTINKTIRYARPLPFIALIVASAVMTAAMRSVPVFGAEPPDHLLKRIAQREAENAYARDSYTYRQTVAVQEFNDHGLLAGEYREVRDITFSREKGRYEVLLENPKSTLKRLKLTEQDFSDIRDIQPFLLTNAQVPLYSLKFRGEEQMNGFNCFVVELEPRQILSGQRFFQGLLWVRQSDLSVVRSEGKAVPQIETLKDQNLFPHFVTRRAEIDGKWFFPVETVADDTLHFRSGPQRMRVQIRYADYKHFGADSTIHFGSGESNRQP